nr:MAG TPA: hypothetical protein [Caudoviricetes sp.]
MLLRYLGANCCCAMLKLQMRYKTERIPLSYQVVGRAFSLFRNTRKL